MNTVQEQQFRERLVRLLDRCRIDAGGVSEEARSPAGGRSTGELSDAPLHLSDAGANQLEHDISAALNENEEHLSQEIAAALVRLDRGEFGRCEQCGERISDERLEAMPFARHCIACAKSDAAPPQADVNAGRPRTPRDLQAPETDPRSEEAVRRAPPAETAFDPQVSADRHAAGEAGGGAAAGGLAGSNLGRGEPDADRLQSASGGGVSEARQQDRQERKQEVEDALVQDRPRNERSERD